MHVVDVLTDRLRALMKEHGVKAAPLARRAQLNESAVRDILRGRSKNPGIVTLSKIAGVLNLRASALYEEEQAWPVIGVVEGDGDIREATAKDLRPSRILNPFFANRSERFASALVRGTSLAPLAFDGDYLIFERPDAGVDEQAFGRPCVCQFEDGRLAVRAVRPGDSADRFHISSVGPYGGAEPNAALKAARRIAFVMPPNFVPNLPEPTHIPNSSVLHEDPAAYDAR